MENGKTHYFLYVLHPVIMLILQGFNTDLSKTNKVQISYYGHDSINGSDIFINISKTPAFKKLIKADYISHDSCRADGKIKYLDSNNVSILDGTFSVECQSLFLAGSRNTYIFSNRAAEELSDHFPFKRRPPHGVMGIISKGLPLPKEGFSPDMIG